MKNILKLSALALMIALGSSANADNVTANIQSRATLSPTCTISVTNIAFGVAIYADIKTGDIVATCTKGTIYNMQISKGAGYNGFQRMMFGIDGPNNGDIVNYQIYTSAARTAIWGDGTAGTSTVNVTGTGATQTTVMTSQVQGGYVTPGNYRDNLVLSVNY